MRRSIIRFAALALILVTAGLGCKFQSKTVREATKPVELTWWRVFEDADTVSPIIEEYRRVHPNISINFRKLRFEEYERELIDALAEDRGPDIFTFQNTATAKYQSKLLPLPANITLGYQVLKGTIKKEVVTEVRTERALRPDQVRNLFVDQVGKDVIQSYQDPTTGTVAERIFGLPLGLDTMVLYYNKDLQNAAGISLAPKRWDEFLDNVELLTKRDTQGKITLSGAAIGTANNVERATDILSVIMMQNGTVMEENGGVLFNSVPPSWDKPESPGLQALRYYTDFANPTKTAYSWDDSMPNSLDAFVNGTAAYFFGYAYHLPIIRARAPKLNFSWAKLPQIDPANEVNFANYWVEGVSNKTTHPNEAWDFLQFAASKDTNAAKYLDVAKKPTALRSLVNSQIEDPDLSIFASEVLTAKSWYQGKDPAAAESAIKEMINSAVSGSMTLLEAINLATGKVQQTIH